MQFSGEMQSTSIGRKNKFSDGPLGRWDSFEQVGMPFRRGYRHMKHVSRIRNAKARKTRTFRDN